MAPANSPGRLQYTNEQRNRRTCWESMVRVQLHRTLQQAAAALGQGKLSECEKLCHRVIEAEPGSVDALNLLSLVRKRSGDPTEAERLMKRALQLDPRRADIRANLGNLCVSLRRLDEAEAAYLGALETEPGFRPARIGLARLLLDLGRADDARAEAETLLRQDSTDAEALNVVGSALRETGSEEEAESAFRRALDIAPGYAIARHNLGALLASVSRSEEALKELDRAASAGLTGPEIDHNRASALIALGRFDEAEESLRDALASNQQAVSVQTLLARILYMRGDEHFADTLQLAVEDYPDDVALRVACSQVLRGAEQFQSARAIVRRGLDLDAQDPRLLAEMSATLQDRGDFGLGLDYAQQAVAADRSEPRLNDLVIQALLALGRGAEAMPLIEEARRRAPLDQSYIAYEATAARLIGDPRYQRLYDYKRLVRSYELPAPAGWPSIAAFHADLIPVLERRHQFVAPPLDQSLRAGTQTPRGLLGDPDPLIRAFLAMIQGPIDEYCDMMGHDAAHPLSARNSGETKFIGCWSVRLHRNGFHVNHVHSEGWISSAYYVEVPDEVRDRDEKSGWIKFGEPRFSVPGATPELLLQPAAGTLVLFPSYMWHGTTPIHGDAPRMTIAFDVVPANKQRR